MRRGELLALRWTNDEGDPLIDFEARTVRVERTLVVAPGGELVLNPPKSHNSLRTVNLDDTAFVILRERRKQQLEERLAAGPVWQETGFVLTRPDGRPLHPNQVSTKFSQLAKRAGYRLSFHALRHAAASYLIDQGIALPGRGGTPRRRSC
jgi:integrase